MNERVFADEFHKGFFREGDFLAFIEEREENSDWEKVKSSELRFYPIADGHRASSMLEEKLREKGKECVFKDTMEHTRLILKVRDELYLIRSCAIKTILEQARVSGDTIALMQVVDAYQPYIKKLAKRKAIDKDGNTIEYVDETVKRTLKITLIASVMKFNPYM